LATSSSTKPARDKVREHRARLRDQGLRPIQMWVSDVRSAAFVLDAHEQSVAVATSGHAHDDQTCIDAISVSAFDEELPA
jgi:hypothetical protein